MKNGMTRNTNLKLKLRAFSEAATQNIIVETARRSAINIHVLMAALSTKMDMEFVPKQ